MAPACGLLLALGAASALDPFVVTFDVTLATGQKDSFDLEVQPDWAPLGAARFKELLDEEFFTSVRFFRVISGFMAQFGIHGKPDVSSKWRERKLKDDPVLLSNKRGYISFATSGTDSRTTQMFINFGDNTNLDGMGFSPFGRVLGNGMDVVDKIYSGHGETPDQVQSPRAGPTWRPPCAPCDCPHCGLELTNARRGPSRAVSRARATSTLRRRSRDSHVHAAGRLPSVSMCPEMRSARLLVIHATLTPLNHVPRQTSTRSPSRRRSGRGRRRRTRSCSVFQLVLLFARLARDAPPSTRTLNARGTSGPPSSTDDKPTA